MSYHVFATFYFKQSLVRFDLEDLGRRAEISSDEGESWEYLPFTGGQFDEINVDEAREMLDEYFNICDSQ